MVCVDQQVNYEPSPIPKAKVQAFLASRPRAELLTGYAARAGYLNLDSQAYDNVKQFIQAL